MSKWPELHSTSWVSNRNSFKLPTCFLTQIWQVIFPFCKWFWWAAPHNSKQVLCSEGWGSRREGGHVEEAQDEHTNSYSVPVQLRIPFGMNETLACAWASSQQYSIYWWADMQKKPQPNKKAGMREQIFHQAMPHGAWLSQSFPVPSSKQLREPVHSEDTLREDSIPLSLSSWS